MYFKDILDFEFILKVCFNHVQSTILFFLFGVFPQSSFFLLCIIVFPFSNFQVAEEHKQSLWNNMPIVEGFNFSIVKFFN